MVRPGIAFWPMAQQYRHIIAANPDRLICNHNLFDVAAPKLSQVEAEALVAVLNSTLVGLFKTFYGCYAGTEGNLKTEVVDVDLLEVPDPRGVSPGLAKRLANALARMGKRVVGRLVAEPLMDCHTPDRARALAAGPLVFSDELRQPDRRELDDGVFELLGVSDPKERQELLGRLYEATARHFRDIRVVEIEKMQQRAKSENKRFSVHDLAADIWDAAEPEEVTRLAEWVSRRPESHSAVTIPEERPAVPKVNPPYSDAAVSFGKSKPTRVDCESAGQAKLMALLADLGVSGDLKMPAADEACTQMRKRVEERLGTARSRFQELAASRTGDEGVRRQLMDVLERWFVLGRKKEARTVEADAEPE